MPDQGATSPAVKLPSVPGRPVLAVTGAAGFVAGLIVDDLRSRYRLRRIDVVDHEGVEDDEVVRADVADVGLMTEAFPGVHGVLHLAAKAFEDDFLTVLLPRNLAGTWSVFEAARRARVANVVFASTGQTMGGNPAGAIVGPETPARPVSVYAATKLFGEALGRYYSDCRGMQVACLRLGWVAPADSPLFATEPGLPWAWCGNRDLAALVQAALASSEPFRVVIAVSQPAARGADTTNPYGWTPEEWPAVPYLGDRREGRNGGPE